MYIYICVIYIYIYIYFALYMIWITMNLRIHKAPTWKEEWASENVQSCWGENLQQLSPLRALWMVAKSCITNLGWLETPWKKWDIAPFSPGESDFAGPSTVPQDTSGYLRTRFALQMKLIGFDGSNAEACWHPSCRVACSCCRSVTIVFEMQVSRNGKGHLFSDFLGYTHEDRMIEWWYRMVIYVFFIHGFGHLFLRFNQIKLR